jgi:predicted Rossmann fold flavoprotein
MSRDAADLVIVGAGAAGLATAIFAARRAPARRVVILDGAARIGAKILVSGGGRCNLTNRSVTPSDYWGGSRRFIASVLRAFSPERTEAFFRELGVALHEEERGKLFPDSNRSRDVLDALTAETQRLGVRLVAGERVNAVLPDGSGWVVRTRTGAWRCGRVVLATGGLSLPKSGSDGRGLDMAASLGHTVVPTTPALVPLLLDGAFHRPLCGISHDAAITIESSGKSLARLQGPLLWTHFGISGPAALDASRHWLRAELGGGPRPSATLSFVPSLDFAGVDAALAAGASQGRGSLRALLSAWLPAAVGGSVLETVRLDGALRPSQLAREDRRRLTHALTAHPLPVTGSRGYTYAEVTAGGVDLDEVEPRTLESRRAPGLYFAGEILDVDGRLGGFNFQWAWSSGWVAGQAAARP